MGLATLVGFGITIMAGSLAGAGAGNAAVGLAVAGAVAAVYFFLTFLFRRLGFWRTVLVLCGVGLLIAAFFPSAEADGGGDC
jgi:hypothetical protein